MRVDLNIQLEKEEIEDFKNSFQQCGVTLTFEEMRNVLISKWQNQINKMIEDFKEEKIKALDKNNLIK